MMKRWPRSEGSLRRLSTSQGETIDLDSEGDHSSPSADLVDSLPGDLTMTTTQTLIRQFDAQRASQAVSRPSTVRSAHRGSMTAFAAANVLRLAVGAATVAVVLSIAIVFGA